jgi:HPt (histidine-containing phosphotransfer) domain-containing protein
VAARKTSGTVDFDYLEGFAAGDRQVVAEVLRLFLQQAELWAGSLDAANPGWPDLVHTIKGAARGVGAHALGDVCERTEAEGAGGLPAVRAALKAAVADVEAYLGA